MRQTPRQQVLFGLTETEKEFADANESLREDISAVRVCLVRDVHYDDCQVEVGIYGREAPNGETPVVHRVLSPWEAGLDEDRLKGGLPVDPFRVTALFDEPLRDLLASKGVRIEWNPGEPTAATIDLANIDPAVCLLATDR